MRVDTKKASNDFNLAISEPKKNKIKINYLLGIANISIGIVNS